MFDCISNISSLEPPKFFSKDEIERHNREIDAWTVIHGKVYDITKFISQHPVRVLRVIHIKLGWSLNFISHWRRFK
jgi:cytochrome b involved in lipid metabolism